MSHHCGLVIENVLPKDEGPWQCNLDLLDGKSNFHTFKKVIDLKVNKRRHQRRRQRDQFSLYGGYGDGDGSSDGSGDEVSRGESLNKLLYLFYMFKDLFQLVGGRLLKPFMTGFQYKQWLLTSK